MVYFFFPLPDLLIDLLPLPDLLLDPLRYMKPPFIIYIYTFKKGITKIYIYLLYL